MKNYLAPHLLFVALAMSGCNSAESPLTGVRAAGQRSPGHTWRIYPGNPILGPGEEGAWDSWAVMSMSVLKVGETFHLYYEGGASGVADLQIGHATSSDGLSWTKDPRNPVLRPGPPGAWDDGATWDPYVIHEDGIFKMWYGGERVGHRDFQCGFATSSDGVNFSGRRRISDFSNGEMADMHVVHDQSTRRYYMYYWDRSFQLPDRLRLASSPDETSFSFENSLPIRIEGEEPGHRYTHVFKSGELWLMYYGFDGGPPRMGFATGRDLWHWTAANKNLMGGEDAEVLTVEDDFHLMFYCPEGLQDEAGCDIRLALFTGNLAALAVPR